MSQAHVLLVADGPDAAAQISGLLTQAGYTISLADDFTTPPPDCEVALVDISLLRSASPFAGLKAQRRMGLAAPAILFVARLTEQMAAELFSLGVQDLVLKPVEDPARLQKLEEFIQRTRQEKDKATLMNSLTQSQAALARRLEEMNTLSRIGKAIGALTEIDTILARIVESSRYLTRAQESAVYLVDSATGQLVLSAQQGMTPARAQAVHQPAQDAHAIAVVQTGRLIMRSREEERAAVGGEPAYALIHVPIASGQKVVGALAVYSQEVQSFEESDQVVLTTLADYAAIALENVSAMKELRDQIDLAAQAGRTALLHAETLFDPVDGIESQVDTLLAGGFGPLNEQQHTAIGRIKQAAIRLKEVVGFIREAMAQA